MLRPGVPHPLGLPHPVAQGLGRAPHLLGDRRDRRPLPRGPGRVRTPSGRPAPALPGRIDWVSPWLPSSQGSVGDIKPLLSRFPQGGELDNPVPQTKDAVLVAAIARRRLPGHRRACSPVRGTPPVTVDGLGTRPKPWSLPRWREPGSRTDVISPRLFAARAQPATATRDRLSDKMSAPRSDY